MTDDDRYLLQDRYLELTRFDLPSKAERQHWRLREDHCFMRVILDHVFQDCWYNHLDRRLPAYKQLTCEQLKTAVHLAERILDEGESLLRQLNAASLLWRQTRA